MNSVPENSLVDVYWQAIIYSYWFLCFLPLGYIYLMKYVAKTSPIVL